MKFKVVRPCIDQDRKKKLAPGDVVDNLSDFERGRHLAENNIVPLDDCEIERAVKAPAERRRRGKRTKDRGERIKETE